MEPSIIQIQEAEGLTWTVGQNPWNANDEPDETLQIERILYDDAYERYAIVCRPTGTPERLPDGSEVGFRILLDAELVNRVWEAVVLTVPDDVTTPASPPSPAELEA